MEFTSDQSKLLSKFIQDWLKDTKYELETTFGKGGVVDATTFLQISQRLRNKGFQMVPQDDRLSIITPSHIRFTLEGLGVLQTYCKDDSIKEKAYTAMFKDRAFIESNLDLHEYNIRFKVRREEELNITTDERVTKIINNWGKEEKAFRLIRRWSFIGNGIRVDMSMVRQTPIDKTTGKFKKSTRFLQYNIFKEMPRYEVEVELLHDTDYTKTTETALKAIIRGVGEVQRAIQKNSLLIRNTVSNAVLNDYTLMVGNRFRGVNPVTLEVKNMTPDIEDGAINIRTGFNVTDKADGLRAMAFVNHSGELFLIDMSMKVYRTGLKNEKCAMSLLDGEWITNTKDDVPMNSYLIFDIYHFNNEDVSSKPFVQFTDNTLDKTAECRFNIMERWFKLWEKGLSMIAKGLTSSNRLYISLKRFQFATPGNASIFQACAFILDSPKEYKTDGLILTSNSEPIPSQAGTRWDYQFKWKPAKDNTVDFLINYEKNPNIQMMDKITTTIHSSSEEVIQYKTMKLYVGSDKNPAFENPRTTILMQLPLPKETDKPVGYGPVPFQPIDFPDTMANICNISVKTYPLTEEVYCETEDSKEPIPDRCIVEMRYDILRESGWRWVPSRIRHDKTERLGLATTKRGATNYSRTMNNDTTANSVWNSIHNPITESMIRSGNEAPKESKESKESKEDPREIDSTKKYYERKAPENDLMLVRGLQDFHNKYIKNDILLKTTLRGGNKRLLDVSCGKGGDLFKWINCDAQYVLGVDISGDNITNPINGAYKRYMQSLLNKGKKPVPPMAFVIGDSSKSIINGKAGATNEESDTLRSIFKKNEPEGIVPLYIKNVMAGTFESGADVTACMFALHYFFENKTVLDGFLQNLSDTVKIGGYFIGCCFDGDKVFNLLRNVKEGQSKLGNEGNVPIWAIKKQYNVEDLIPNEESIGLAIDVEFISIGTTHREYLVPFEFLTKKLNEIGFSLLDNIDLQQIGLNSSTNTFDISYNMAEKNGKHYHMPESVKQFSFLNRWFIFKRRGILEVEPIAMPFGKGLKELNSTYKLFNTVESSDYSVLKPWHKKQVRAIMLSWFIKPDSVRYIVDGTAHIGADTVHMASLFPDAHIDAFEIVPDTFEKLRNNIIRFENEGLIKKDRITTRNEDITLWEPSHPIDILYVDPPWGGTDYDRKATLNLFLEEELKEGYDPNPSKNINIFIDKWIRSGKIKNIVLKAPSNFNDVYLNENYSIQKETVSTPAGKISYTLIRIPSQPTESVAKIVEEKEDAAAAVAAPPKIELDMGLPPSDKRFTAKDIFVFGIDVSILPDKVSIKNAKGKEDKHIARWLSLAAPFPIPDPDDASIKYPSIEHYLAGMKLKYTSNKPDLAVTLMSNDGDIHQTYLRTRLAPPAIKNETLRDFELLAKEADDVRKRMTSPELKKYDVTINEDKWKLLKDETLMYALRYRWEIDRRFHDIVEAAREANKYLIYNTATAASELGGKRSIKTSMIEGENKVGRFIMELANFKFK